MAPTLEHSNFVLVHKLAYAKLSLGPFDFLIPGRDNGDFLLGGPGRGDVVVFHSPSDPERDFVKRVIGLPGDRIEVRDGEVLVNGQGLEERQYIRSAPTYEYPQAGLPLVVPPKHYFVLGDNRNASQDSHVFGPIHERLLVGAVIFRWLPLDSIGGGGGRDLVTTGGGAVPEAGDARPAPSTTAAHMEAER